MEPNIFARADGEADFDFYPYNPSAGAGYAFVVIFGIASAIHLVYIGIYRTWFFTPFLLGCIGTSTQIFKTTRTILILQSRSRWLLRQSLGT